MQDSGSILEGISSGDIEKKMRMLDLVLVVDVSGSMGPCIQNLVANLYGLVAEVEKGEGMSSKGMPVRVDWRIAIVGHQSEHQGKTSILFLNLTNDLKRIQDALSKLVGRVTGSEATLHAMDWAMDNVQWRGQSGYRRFLAVFTDEPVQTGDVEGINEQTADQFERKLHNFNLFLVAPFETDTSTPMSYGRLKSGGFTKGAQNVPGARAEDWQSIDFKQLTDRLGKTLTMAGGSDMDQAVQADVFGLASGYRVEQL
jgi:hypothetical protein